MKSLFALGAPFAVLVVFAACGGDDDDAGPGGGIQTGPMLFASDSFASGELMPAEFTCEGADVSPDLAWGDVPADAESLVLLVEDPDAGDFPHWVVYDIPADSADLAQDVSDGDTVASGGTQGENGFGDVGYGGPCPPSGEEHEYRFSLYALDAELGLEPGASAGEVKTALADHVLALSQIAIVFAR